MTILEAFCTVFDDIQRKQRNRKSCIVLCINNIHKIQENSGKSLKKRQQEGATDFTAVFQCQDSIIHTVIRTTDDTILTSLKQLKTASKSGTGLQKIKNIQLQNIYTKQATIMKRQFFTALLALMMSVGCNTATAQQQDSEMLCMEQKQQGKEQTKQRMDRQRQRMTREELAERQARYIAQSIALDEETTEKYVSTFCEYQKEVWALRSDRKGKKQAEMSESEIEKNINDNFDYTEKLLAIRKKYYKIYSKFMTQRQIQRAYEMERKAMGHLAKRKANMKDRKGGTRQQRRTRQ